MFIELVEQGPYGFRPAIAGDPDGQVVLVVAGGAGQEPDRGLDVGVAGEPEPDVAAGDLALELAGGALGDQMALVEHGDPVRQPVGLVEVLGGQEDGPAVWGGWPGPGRSGARPGRLSRAGPPASWPGPAFGACPPNRSMPACGPI